MRSGLLHGHGGAGRELERCELLLALGAEQRRAGAVVDARATFAEAGRLARSPAEPRLLAAAALGYAGALGGPGLSASTDQHIVALLEEALEAIGAQRSTERAQLLARLALELYYTPALQRRFALSKEAVATGDTRSQPIAMYSRHWSSLGPDRVGERRRAADRLLDRCGFDGGECTAGTAHRARAHRRRLACRL